MRPTRRCRTTPRSSIETKIADYKEQDKKLTSDPERGEGLDELFVKGKALEAARDQALQRGPYFDYGQALLQIAIVLASVAIISAAMLLLVVSFVLGGFGAVLNDRRLYARISAAVLRADANGSLRGRTSTTFVAMTPHRRERVRRARHSALRPGLVAAPFAGESDDTSPCSDRAARVSLVEKCSRRPRCDDANRSPAMQIDEAAIEQQRR